MNRFIAIRSALLLALVCIPATLAAATPTDVVLVMDNSGSMRKNDPGFLARRAAAGFIDALGDDVRAGVIIFDQKVNFPVPLTAIDAQSRSRLAASLEGIDYRGKFTDSPAAMERAIYELKTRGREAAERAIVFMTDGIVDTGNAAADLEKARWLREDLAAEAAASGIRVYAIAFTENADFFLIQSLAKKTRGDYYRAPVAEALAAVFAEIGKVIGQPAGLPPAAAGPAPEAALPPAPSPAVAATIAPEATPPTAAPAPAAPAQAPAETPAAPLKLEDLSPEDRRSLEETAKETGIPVEDLFAQIMSAPEGEPVVVRPESAAEQDEPQVPAVVIVAALMIAAGGLVVWFVLRRRVPPPAAGPAVAVAPAPPVREIIPEAFLKDIHHHTDAASIRLGEKPLMVGRVAGTDTEHLGYLVVNQPTVGRRHAVIKYRDFAFWIIEQGSVNGTFINDERISGERQLHDGDRVKFHKFEFEFSMPDMEDAAHTVFADPNDATIAADMAATMVGTMAAEAHAHPGVGIAESPRPPAGEREADEDFFTAEGEMPAAPMSLAEGGDDLFDLSDEPVQAAPPAFGDDTFDETPVAPVHAAHEDAPAAAHTPDSRDETGATGDEFAEVGVSAAAGDQAQRDAVDALEVRRREEEFDAEASAFFDEITVGPTPDDEGAPVPYDDDLFAASETPTVRRPDVRAEPTPSFEQATAILEAPPPAGGFSETETVVLDQPVGVSAGEGEAAGDPNDITLEAFLETSAFDAPKTIPPAMPQRRAASVDDFMSTAVLGAGNAAPRNADITRQPAGDTGDAADKALFDVTGVEQRAAEHGEEADATLLPGEVADRPAKPAARPNSESTTVFNVDDKRRR